MTKTFVAMEAHVCGICGKTHETGSILFHKNMREVFSDKKTVTGTSPCPACKALLDEGRIAVVEVIEETRARTGNIAWVTTEAWSLVFTVPVPEHRVCMAPPVVLKVLERAADEARLREAEEGGAQESSHAG